MSLDPDSSKKVFFELTYPHVQNPGYTLDENLPPLQPPPPLPSPKCNNTVQSHRNSLDVLSLELLHLVISQLDIRTLANFLWAGRSTLELVQSHPQYQAINTHARGALRGILAIGTGQGITCAMLYTSLCTANCQHCGEYGSHLYLLTCKRLCFRCFCQQKEYLPLQYSHAIRMFGLSRRDLESLPQMKSLPGTYSIKRRIRRDQLKLVDYESARNSGIKLHGSLDAMEEYVSNLSRQKAEMLQERNSATSSGSVSRRPPTVAPFDGQAGNPLRFMAIIKIPWLNRSSHVIEPAHYCLGCEIFVEEFYPQNPHFRQKFTVYTFDAHLREYGSITNGRHHPGGLYNPPP